MSAKALEYLKSGIIILIAILLLFILNLPKPDPVDTIVFALFFIFMEIFFPFKNRDVTSKREYITAILFFIIFATPVFIFDLSKKLYIFIGILTISILLLNKLFDSIKNKYKKT
ncbi:hypothetical protein GCM10028778_21810 [Barrientosiimonas marina]